MPCHTAWERVGHTIAAGQIAHVAATDNRMALLLARFLFMRLYVHWRQPGPSQPHDKTFRKFRKILAHDLRNNSQKLTQCEMKQTHTKFAKFM
jgi:hypothetical protein